MKVIFTAPASLLLAVALLCGAHAGVAPLGRSDDSTHLDRRNLVCHELQGLGLSGPACDSVAVGDAAATPLSGTEALTQQQHHNLCPVLCKNQLGSDSCACEFLPVADRKFFDVDQVCNGFCAESVALNGCSCGRAAQLPPPPVPVYRPANLLVGGECTGNCTQPSVSVENTTEPDWDSLCVTLCKLGEGGALCNCDKPPFV